MSRTKYKVKNKGEIWEPLTRRPDLERAHRAANEKLHHYDEIWTNRLYCVFVRFDIEGLNESLPFKFTWLSIKRHDKAPSSDWRHYQFIKNQLCGPESEGAQLFPAESRLIDGSNQYHLWVINAPGFSFPFGFNEGRMISEHPFPGGGQRPWPANLKPEDLEEQEAKSDPIA